MRAISLLLVVAGTAYSVSTCGLTPIKPNTDDNSKIVGGTVAVPYSWPWQVVLRYTNPSSGFELICGGTVIDNGWIMTSAFCLDYDITPSNYMIRAAVFKQNSTTESGEQISAVKSINIHPQFSQFPVAYDIALIELATPLIFTDHVQPICLTKIDRDAIKPGNRAWVTGWGTTKVFGDNSEQLRQVQVTIVDFQRCLSEDDIFEKFTICTEQKEHDSCDGDSGGPLAIQGPSGAWYQIGIVAYGNEGCGEDPGVNSRVQAYCDFIEKTTKGQAKCQEIV